MPHQRGEQMPISEKSSGRTMMPLIHHLFDYNNCQNMVELEEAMRKNYESNVEFIRSLHLKTNHLRPPTKNIPLQAAFLTRKSARALLAFKGEMRVTVYQFYYLRHRLRLIHPQLPCIAVKGGNGHLSFYPLEVIDAANQQNEEKVKNIKLHKNIKFSQFFRCPIWLAPALMTKRPMMMMMMIIAMTRTRKKNEIMMMEQKL